MRKNGARNNDEIHCWWKKMNMAWLHDVIRLKIHDLRSQWFIEHDTFDNIFKIAKIFWLSTSGVVSKNIENSPASVISSGAEEKKRKDGCVDTMRMCIWFHRSISPNEWTSGISRRASTVQFKKLYFESFLFSKHPGNRNENANARPTESSWHHQMFMFYFRICSFDFWNIRYWRHQLSITNSIFSIFRNQIKTSE